MTSVLKGATPAGIHLVYSWLEKLPLFPLHYETQRASEEVCPVLSSKQSSTFVLLSCFCFGLEIGEGYFKGHKQLINSGGFFFFMCVCLDESLCQQTSQVVHRDVSRVAPQCFSSIPSRTKPRHKTAQWAFCVVRCQLRGGLDGGIFSLLQSAPTPPLHLIHLTGP